MVRGLKSPPLTGTFAIGKMKYEQAGSPDYGFMGVWGSDSKKFLHVQPKMKKVGQEGYYQVRCISGMVKSAVRYQNSVDGGTSIFRG